MLNKFITVSCSTLSLMSPAFAGICELEKQFEHGNYDYDRKITISRSVYGEKQFNNKMTALFFTAPMQANTDGAPNSYHPNDLSGRNGKAINTICNGVSAVLKNGTKYGPSQCQELIDAYREARSHGWENDKYPRINFFGIAKSEKNVPFINKSGKYKGYFVSTTSLAADESKANSDQDRYLNALELPFSIVPKKSEFTRNGVSTKDVVIYYNPKTKIFEYGLVGDTGPTNGMAEGSIAMGRVLKSKSSYPKSKNDAYSYAITKIHALMLPTVSLQPPYTASNIRSRAKMAFEKWGGKERFLDCVTEIGK